jgi:membrane associated rhomboid family serine protease
MFLLLPTGHEETTARRWPFVTIGLVVVNLLVFVLLLPVERHREIEAQLPYSLAVEHLQKHPYLTPPPLLEPLLSPSDHEEMAKARAQVPVAPPGEQERLDELAATAQAAILRMPSQRYGYRPADRNWLGLITHQFLHGGWLHLLGNLWFLWLAGYVLEDAWGRLAYPAFYLAAGICGAIGHHLAEPSSHASLVGASGAIAGLMGAFLVRNAKTKIKFFMLLLVRPFRFQAPAFVMLPLWFAEQVVYGLRMPGGVAYFAHVGGFVFGAGVALVLRQSGAEKRLDTAIENRGALLEDPAITEVATLIDNGQATLAVARLDRLLSKEPRRIDAWLAQLRAAAVLGDLEREKRARLKLMELYLQQGLGEGALSLYEELPEAARLDAAPPSLRLRIGRQYERAGRVDQALQTFDALHVLPRGAAAVRREHRQRGADRPRRARAQARDERASARAVGTRSGARRSKLRAGGAAGSTASAVSAAHGLTYRRAGRVKRATTLPCFHRSALSRRLRKTTSSSSTPRGISGV